MRKILILFLFFILFLCSSCSKQDDVTTISFSTWGSQSEINTIKFLIEQFEQKNAKIKVNLIHIPDNYFQKLHLLIASNLAPDVIFINNLNYKIYFEAGKFEPLNKYIGSSKFISKSDFIPNSLAPFFFNGNIFVIPRDISNLVVYYNKDLFDSNNLTYPDDSWTTSDFLKIAQNLTQDYDNDGKTDVFGFGFEKNSLFWLPFLLSNGGGILSKDAKNILINETSSKEALQFYSDLRNKYKVSPDVSQQASLTTSQLFLQGKVAMHLCGRWCSLTYKKNADFAWDIVRFPAGKKGSIVAVDVSGWAISSDSKNKEAAWKLIEFLSSDESIFLLTSGGLIFPAKKNIANSSVFLQSPPENAKAFISSVNNAIPTPVNVKYAEINDLLNENLESLFNGNSSVDDIINSELLNKFEKLRK